MNSSSSGNLDVVGLGLATIDVLVRCEPASDPSRRPAFREFRLEGGGPVATAMAAASRLGVRTGFVGTAGSDFAGECKLLSLSRYGVDVSRVVIRPSAEKDVVLVWVDAETGERSFSGLAGAMSDALRPEEIDRDYVTSAPYLHLDGCHGEAALAAARWMHEAGGTVVLDGPATHGIARDRIRKLVEQVDVLVCGSGFAQAVTGESDAADACRAAVELGPRTVVQTEGPDGSYTVCADGEFHTPAFEVDAVDTTGAGDVFHGAYIVGLIKGWDARRTAAFASAAAAMSCTRVGGRTGVSSFEETLEFCRSRGVGLVD